MGMKNKETKIDLFICNSYRDIQIKKCQKLIYLTYYVNFSLVPALNIIQLIPSDSLESQLQFNVS